MVVVTCCFPDVTLKDKVLLKEFLRTWNKNYSQLTYCVLVTVNQSDLSIVLYPPDKQLCGCSTGADWSVTMSFLGVRTNVFMVCYSR